MTRAEQRAQALLSANAIRRARSAWKRELRELPLEYAIESACRLILHPPVWAENWRLVEVLDALPRIGPSKVQRALTACQIGEGRRLGPLTVREREAVYAWLRARLSS